MRGRLTLLGFGLAIVFLLWVAAAAEASLPPPTGDWVVTGDTNVSGLSLVVNGSLIVDNQSTLWLSNVTLRFDAPSAGVSWINISLGATLRLDGGSVDRGDPATRIGGNISGSVLANGTRLDNITYERGDGTGGAYLNGGGVALIDVRMTGCRIGFTVISGWIDARGLNLSGCSGAFVKADPNGTGPLSLNLSDAQVAQTPLLGSLVCGNCTQPLSIRFARVEFVVDPRPFADVVYIAGKWGDVLLRGSEVNVSGSNYTLFSVSSEAIENVSVNSLDAHLDNISLSGPYPALFGAARLVISGGVRLDFRDLDAPTGLVTFIGRAPVAPGGRFLATFVGGSVGGALFSIYQLDDIDVEVSNVTFGRITVSSIGANSSFGVRIEDSIGRAPPGSDPKDVDLAVVGGFGGMANPRVEVKRTSFQRARSGMVAGCSWGAGFGKLDLDVVDSQFANLGSGIVVGGQADVGGCNVRLQNDTVSATGTFLNVTSFGSSAPRAAISLTVRDINSVDVGLLVDVNANATVLDTVPIFFVVEDVTASRTASLLNYTGAGADLMQIRRIQGTGNGTGSGVWVKYSGRLNLSLTDIAISDYTQGIRVERTVASFQPDDWNISNISVLGASIAVDLRAAHVIDGRFSLDRFHINATEQGVIVGALRGNITNGTIEGWGRPVEIHDSEVYVRDTYHNIHNVLTDFRLGEGFLEGWGNYSFAIGWAATHVRTAGWRLQAACISGEPMFDTVLDADGRAFQGERSGMLYRFILNLSNYDCRTFVGNLSVPGRAPTPVTIELEAGGDVLVELYDTLAPALSLPQLQPDGEIVVNSTATLMEVGLYDPETGLLDLVVDVQGENINTYSASGGPLSWNLSVPLGLPSETAYLVVLTARDVNGSVAIVKVRVTLDLTAPIATVISLAPGGAVNSSAVHVEFASDPDTASISVNGVPAAKLSSFSDDRPWGINLTLSEGWHDLVVVAADIAGNRRTTSFLLEVDLTPPDPSVAGISDGLAVAGSPLPVEVTSDVNDTVFVDGMALAGVGGRFVTNLSLAIGDSVHRIEVVDRAGNRVELVYAVTFDVVPPTIAVERPWVAGTRNYVNATAFNLTFDLALDVETVLFGASSLSPGTPGHLVLPIILPAGESTLHFEAVDRAGNRAALALIFVVDTTPPSLVASDPPDGHRVSRRAMVLYLTVTEPGEISIGSIIVPAPDGSANFSLVPLEGPFSVVVNLTDLAGNFRQVTLHFIGDFDPPTLSVATPLNGSTVPGPTFHIAGVTEAGAALRINGVLIAVGEGGAFGVDVPLGAGTSRFAIVATDEAGNEATSVLEITRATPGPDVGLFAALGAVAVLAGATVIGLKRRRGKGANPEPDKEAFAEAKPPPPTSSKGPQRGPRPPQ